MDKKHILVIDDEPDLVTLLESRLRNSGYRSSTAGTAAEGITAARNECPDLILLDISLPDGDGFDVCKKLRSDAATRATPIIMLTARGTATDEVLGLELGADDFVTKPYDYRVLESRIKRLMLKKDPTGSNESSVSFEDDRITAPGIIIDLRARQATVEDQPADLTPQEFRILAAMAGKPGRIFTREELISDTWKEGKTDDASHSMKVNNHINHLRRKLGSAADRIETVHGSGYRFRA